MAEETGCPARHAAEPAFAVLHRGMTATARVAVTYGIVELILSAGSALIRIELGLFIAADLDPAVN